MRPASQGIHVHAVDTHPQMYTAACAMPSPARPTQGLAQGYWGSEW